MKVTIQAFGHIVEATVSTMERNGTIYGYAKVNTKKGPVLFVSAIPKRTLKDLALKLGDRLGDDEIGGFWDKIKKFAKSKAVQAVIKTLAGIGKNPQAMAALSSIPYAGPILAGGATASAALEPAASIYERVKKGDPKAIQNVRMLAKAAPFNPVAQKALSAIAKAKDLGANFDPENMGFVGANKFDYLGQLLRQIMKK